jgi:hypothetical protein
MTGDPVDFSHVRVGNSVLVHMGAGWAKGIMSNRFKDHVLVSLKDQRRVVAVWDARSIKPV